MVYILRWLWVYTWVYIMVMQTTPLPFVLRLRDVSAHSSKKKRAGKYRVIYWTDTQSHTPTQFSILRKSFSQQNSTRHEGSLQRTFGKSVLLSLSNRIDFEILS